MSSRGSQFLKNLVLPWTADDLLSTRLGEPVTLVAHPNLPRLKKPKSRYWKILFFQTELSEKLRSLQEIDVHIFQVAEFFESRQIIDRMTGLWHSVEITINNAKMVIFPEEIFQYERITKYINKRGLL